MAGTGHFTISRAIADAGAITDYRTVTGDKILIRRVAVGQKGTITVLITLYTVRVRTWEVDDHVGDENLHRTARQRHTSRG